MHPEAEQRQVPKEQGENGQVPIQLRLLLKCLLAVPNHRKLSVASTLHRKKADVLLSEEHKWDVKTLTAAKTLTTAKFRVGGRWWVGVVH